MQRWLPPEGQVLRGHSGHAHPLSESCAQHWDLVAVIKVFSDVLTRVSQETRDLMLLGSFRVAL